MKTENIKINQIQCPKTPDLKDWIDGMIEIASYESVLGRLQSEGEIKKNMGSFLATYKNGVMSRTS